MKPSAQRKVVVAHGFQLLRQQDALDCIQVVECTACDESRMTLDARRQGRSVSGYPITVVLWRAHWTVSEV